MPNKPQPYQYPVGLTSKHLFWLLIFVSLLLGYDVISHLKGGIGDEDVHRYQINWFVEGRYQIFKYVTMLPLYHFVVAMIGKLTGLVSLNGLRFSHMLFAAGAIPAMYLLVKRFYPREAESRTLLLVFTPFLFPLFFLTYTDLPSLMFVLFMVERTSKQRYWQAALLALCAVLMRQPNIIWVTFCSFMIALDTAKQMRVRLFPDATQLGLLNKDFIKRVLWRNRYVAAVYLLFVGFVFFNGGVAVGDAEQHPISFNLSNLYFFLLVAFALFLPFNIEQLPNIKTLLWKSWWILLLLIGGFFIYFYTYEHPHKYNRSELSFYRHNLIIHYTCDILPLRIASYFPMAWMVLSFVTAARTSEYGRLLYLLYPFAALSFVPLPLIEQRYYVVALMLFLVWRPPMSRRSTLITLGAFVILSTWILFNISRKIFFL